MATVHPSRLGLVPQGSSFDSEKRYSGVDKGRTRSHERRDHDSSYRRDSRRGDSRDRGRGSFDDRRAGRSPSPYEKMRGRDDDKACERDDRARRSSPDYSAYRKEGRSRGTIDNDRTREDVPAPGHVSENMYASRGRGRPSGGEDYFASRRVLRASKEVNIWPPSPREPSHDFDRANKKRSGKRGRSPSVSSSSSSDERERRRRKEKRRREKRNREERKEKHRKKHRREKSYDDDSDEDRQYRRRRSRSYRSGDDESGDDDRRTRSRSKSEKRRERSPQKSRSSRTDTPPRSHVDEDEEEWVEKPADSFVAVAEHTGRSPHMDSMTTRGERKIEEESDSDEVGPQPAPRASTTGKKVDERQYGGALLRGEGSAMAAFLQDGDTQARIPRRGEIGLAPDEIAQFEAVGYVMSGSRHRRMNAVRMRKENQVISAEEKRGILKLQKEERERREAILRDEFRELVQDKLKGNAPAPSEQNVE